MHTKNLTLHNQVSKVIIEEMFQVKTGETIAITADSGSCKKTVDAFAEAVENAGGKFLVIYTPKAEFDGQDGVQYWPAQTLTAALCTVDVWIELQSVVMLYSNIWETAFDKNKKLRYLVLGNASIESMQRTFTNFNIDVLGQFLEKVKEMSMQSKVIKITSENGTNVTYETNLNYLFDYDDGNFSKPIFGTAPGYVNIIPKTNSMNGTIVFDLLTNADVYNSTNHVEFLMKDGKIAAVNGNDEAEKVKSYLASFNDENMYKISHNMLGFNPGIRTLCGEIVEDERIWGGVDFGFGHTSPMDMPPFGQPAKSHFDGVVAKVSIFFDDVQIVDNGSVCHPALKPLAEKLLNL